MRFLSLVTPWLWPSAIKEKPSVGIRLGRVLHWSFALLAALSVVIGVFATLNSYDAHRQSLMEISNWKKSHYTHDDAISALRNAQKSGDIDAIKKLSDFVSKFDKPISIATGEPDAVDPPYEFPAAPEYLWVGGICGLVLLLIGRAIRYVLAAE